MTHHFDRKTGWFSEIRSSLKEIEPRVVRRVLFPEVDDDRIRGSVLRLKNQSSLRPILVTAQENLPADLAEIDCIMTRRFPARSIYAKALYERRRDHGMTVEESERLVNDPLYFSLLHLAAGGAESVIAGASHTTSDTIRAALATVGLVKRVLFGF